MKRRQILLDEASDRILTDLAGPGSGNRSRVVQEAIKAHAGTEAILDEIESFHSTDLQRQKERSEKGFREGKSTSWKEVKRRSHL